MLPTPRKLRASATALLLALVPAACAENGTPVASEPVASPPRAGTMLDCRGTTRPLAVTCGDQDDPDEVARGIIVGANTYAKLASSNVFYDASTEEFSFDVTVTNYMPQPMGTSDGVTPSPSGVHVFFEQPLSVVEGSGTATILNADGAEDTYFGSNQAYFRYSGALLGPDGILSNSEKSGIKRWRFSVPATVESFTFRLNVSGDLPFPSGWVDFTPGSSAVILQGTRGLNPGLKLLCTHVAASSCVRVCYALGFQSACM